MLEKIFFASLYFKTGDNKSVVPDDTRYINFWTHVTTLGNTYTCESLVKSRFVMLTY